MPTALKQNQQDVCREEGSKGRTLGDFGRIAREEALKKIEDISAGGADSVCSLSNSSKKM